MRIGILSLLVMVGVVGPGERGYGREISIPPITSLRVVNPSDPTDVRLLYRFTLTREVLGADVVRAFLTFPADGRFEVPVAVAPLDEAWTDQDSWTTLQAKLQGSPAFTGLGPRTAITCNRVEESRGRRKNAGIEVSATDWVQMWVREGENHGLCVRRPPGRTDDLDDLLDLTIDPPVLTVIYLASERTSPE